MYQDIPHPEIIRWVKFWKNPKNEFHILAIHYTSDPDKDPERDWAEWFEEERKSKPLAKWNKEYEIDFTTKSGQLVFGSQYCDFDPWVHFIDSKEVDWELLFSLDFGQSNPNAWYVAKYDKDWTIYIIDEYFKPAIPSVAAKDMFMKFAHHMWKTREQMAAMTIDQKRNLFRTVFGVAVVDPSVRSKNRTTVKAWEEIPFSVLEDFFDNWMDLDLGNNDWQAWITRIREYFKIKEDWSSSLYIFRDKCPKLCEELVKYKYRTQTKQQERINNSSEKPVKKNDHGVDSLRYLMLTRPNKPEDAPKELTVIQKDIQNLLKPTNYYDLWNN